MKRCKECGYAHNHAHNANCQECKAPLPPPKGGKVWCGPIDQRQWVEP